MRLIEVTRYNPVGQDARVLVNAENIDMVECYTDHRFLRIGSTGVQVSETYEALRDLLGVVVQANPAPNSGLPVDDTPVIPAQEASNLDGDWAGEVTLAEPVPVPDSEGMVEGLRTDGTDAYVEIEPGVYGRALDDSSEEQD